MIRRRRASFVLVAVLAVTAGACSDGDGDGGGRAEVLLEPADSAGPDAFTTDIEYAAVTPSTTPASTPPPTTAAGKVQRIAGGAPGLYGGTRDIATCDVDKMVSFLADHDAEAKAWADVEGIESGELEKYVRGLTPVLLRVDTRVTNHGFRDGEATARQAVLQAGTAVLVDERGVPRVKCACGNPLLPPVRPDAEVDYTGRPWAGFSPANVTVIVGDQTVTQFTVIDLQAGETFTQPAGRATAAPGSSAQAAGDHWSLTAYDYRGQNGKRVTYDCPPPASLGTVWGSGPYTDDSYVCSAAVHAGAVTADRGGQVVIEITGPQDSWTGSTRNGVTTRDYGFWHGGFTIVSASP